MRSLETVRPTPEQLGILSNFQPGTMIIRGAAGSGKTTTAILRLRSLLGSFVNRRLREENEEPVRALVLTFNRTLRGYIDDLVRDQIGADENVELEISTFARWARTRLPALTLVEDAERRDHLARFGARIPLPTRFLVEEAEYVLGRFLPEDRAEYLECTRYGRGATPRVDTATRAAILEQVVQPYDALKRRRLLSDWNDLAVHLAEAATGEPYDIIIADECQDFSANEIRALTRQLKPGHSLTLIIDSVQRIYARGFAWAEVGIVRPMGRHLKVNYRSTVQIARFALAVLDGLPVDEDGTVPDFRRSIREGREPVVLRGRFRDQMGWALNYIREEVDLENQSVAFLHPKGGGWFRYVRQELTGAGLEFVELTGQSEWPRDATNIGLSTMHSAKGLEFDHVFALGLSEECLSSVGGEEDQEAQARRLLAMGIGRAKDFVCLGYSPNDAAAVLEHLNRNTYVPVDL